MNKKFEVFCFGEVLWDNFPEGRRIGGAPLNVCYHLNKSGIDSIILSRVGLDADGHALLNEAKALGVATEHIQQDSSFPTSTVDVHMDPEGKASYEIVSNVAWDQIQYTPALAERIQQASAFVFGSLAARNEPSKKALLSYLQHAARTVFDCNLRSPFYDKKLIIELLERTNILKLNDEELLIIANWLDCHGTEEVDIVSDIFMRFTLLEEIILTKGALGASYFSKTLQLSLPGISVNVRDTVGSGDAFLAAFLAEKIQTDDVHNAMRNAINLSAFVATQKGACPPYDQHLISNQEIWKK